MPSFVWKGSCKNYIPVSHAPLSTASFVCSWALKHDSMCSLSWRANVHTIGQKNELGEGGDTLSASHFSSCSPPMFFLLFYFYFLNILCDTYFAQFLLSLSMCCRMSEDYVLSRLSHSLVSCNNVEDVFMWIILFCSLFALWASHYCHSNEAVKDAVIMSDYARTKMPRLLLIAGYDYWRGLSLPSPFIKTLIDAQQDARLLWEKNIFI